MIRVSILLVVILWIAIPAAAQTKGNAKDQEALMSIAQKWQDAWNQHDMKALAALVAENVDFITVGGTWLKSQKNFEEHHAIRHQMQFKESIWITKNAKVKFVKPDVAVVHVNWGMRGDKDPDGTTRQPRDGIFTWMLEKKKGRWLIIASQNTNISQPVPSK